MKDLYLVGLGIDSRKHLTAEASAVLKRCRIVFHINHDQRWLKRFNRNVIDLKRLYFTGDVREAVYERLRARVTDEMKKGPGVALVTYGNPMIFDSVCNGLRDYCRRRRKSLHIVAGVSSLDMIPIDLPLDYLRGAQIYGATSLVRNRHPINNRAMTLLLQAGEYDFTRTADRLDLNKPRFGSLVKYLRQYYPPSHPVTFIYSHDGVGGKTLRMRLADIDRNRRKIFPGMTLYMPALAPREG